MQHIRNFSIIAHIDHGKSTLADRFLELTHTIESRKMRDQVLDSMDLERERGITIKMQPVRMEWEGVVFNLIDTPGHIDFSYEVSRALTAVEGAILLVDATQGVQAQTLTTLRAARELGLVIIPAISKIDSPIADVPAAKAQVSKLLDIAEDEILLCSGRTGEGVEELLQEVIAKVPPPKNADVAQNDAEKPPEDFLYKDLTYTIRGVLFQVRKNLGLGHKEQIYHSALEIEFQKAGLRYESKKNIPLLYEGKKIGTYQPDFVIEDKVLIELKALPEIGKPQTEQVWSYLKGCEYKLALLANFGSKDLEIRRVVYDTAREPSALSASSQRSSAISDPRALIFDFQYSDHQGVIVYLRLFAGAINKGETLEFAATGRKFTALEVGTFSPKPTPRQSLGEGEIGYVVTGIKEPGLARVGDTIRAHRSATKPLPGYAEPKPVVWASVYPESQDDFVALRHALQRLRLSDSSLSFEEESSGMLGRGFRCGLLGMLHLEIVTERLRREANLSLVVTTPSITYEVELKSGERKTIYSPSLFPDYGLIAKVWEPFVAAEIILPSAYLGAVVPLLFEHEAVTDLTENFSDERLVLHVTMPLRELMRNFFDKMKSASSGYASVSYEMRELRLAEVARLDVLVAEEVVPAFTRIVAKHRVEEEAQAAVEKLYGILPRQQFATKIQAQALGRIISSKTLSALSKDVTQHMYGGDITRKMKLREKQKKGKKRMKASGRVNIPEEVFLKMVKSE